MVVLPQRLVVMSLSSTQITWCRLGAWTSLGRPSSRGCYGISALSYAGDISLERSGELAVTWVAGRAPLRGLVPWLRLSKVACGTACGTVCAKADLCGCVSFGFFLFMSGCRSPKKAIRRNHAKKSPEESASPKAL
jgi:hypothetical protein